MALYHSHESKTKKWLIEDSYLVPLYVCISAISDSLFSTFWVIKEKEKKQFLYISVVVFVYNKFGLAHGPMGRVFANGPGDLGSILAISLSFSKLSIVYHIARCMGHPVRIKFPNNGMLV